MAPEGGGDRRRRPRVSDSQRYQPAPPTGCRRVQALWPRLGPARARGAVRATRAPGAARVGEDGARGRRGAAGRGGARVVGGRDAGGGRRTLGSEGPSCRLDAADLRPRGGGAERRRQGEGRKGKGGEGVSPTSGVEPLCEGRCDPSGEVRWKGCCKGDIGTKAQWKR